MNLIAAFALGVLTVMARADTAAVDVEALKIDNTRQFECDAPSKKGDELTVHYVGTLYGNGKEFDSSRSRGDPFRFTIGRGQVIEGWEQGMLGMCPGDIRVLIIPSKMAYGESGAGGVIPGKSALMFEVEMISVNGKTFDGVVDDEFDPEEEEDEDYEEEDGQWDDENDEDEDEEEEEEEELEDEL